MLVGKKITLRALEEADLPKLQEWRNNENFRKYFREFRDINSSDQQKWFEKYAVKNDNTIMFGIIENKTEKLIGAAGLCYINWVYRNADLSLYIGKDDIYIDNCQGGYAHEALDLLLEYAFSRLNLHKVWSEIYAFDEAKGRFFTDYGLKKDAVLRDNYFYNGEYMNSYIYSILSNEWAENHLEK